MNSYSQLEYDKIKALIAAECHCSCGLTLAGQLSRLPDPDAIRMRQQIISELQALQKNELSFDFSRVADLKVLLTQIKHNIFNFAELRQIWGNISTANSLPCPPEIIADHPHYSELCDRLYRLPHLEKRFSEIFDSEGNVLDTASEQLKSLRRRQRRLRQNVVGILNDKIEEYDRQNFLQDKLVTQREGRFVIPVREAQSSFVPGIIHARSGSRASVFIEPQEVVGLNNEIELLISSEKEEIYRILSQYSAEIRSHSQQILSNSEILSQLDFYAAAARLANHLGAVCPRIVPQPYLQLKSARHPLLIETLRDIDQVIPFDLELGQDYRLLLISGPNTGGKTVTLKTIGLLTLMALSGLPIPAEIDSTIGFFSHVLADIGDNQSLENALSTFSSHLTNIQQMLTEGDAASLVLIDEIGAATDPEQGSALAQAILEELAELDLCGVITTHYTALKVFAEQHQNCRNAAMQFDLEKHLPTYKFQLGLPGNSFAIEVANRLGLKENLITRAKALCGSQNVEMTELLSKLSEEKNSLARNNYQLELRSALLNQKIGEYRQKSEALVKESKAVKLQARRDARDYLTGLQKELNYEISQISKMDKAKRKQAMEKKLTQINRSNKELGQMLTELENDQRTPAVDLHIGKKVWLRDVETEGEIVSISGQAVKVDLDNMFYTSAPENLFEPFDSSKEKKTIRGKQPPAAVEMELKILGFTFEEAKPEIDRFLDKAALSGLENVRIVHGKGTGALRKKVRQYLRSQRSVLEFYSPAPAAGGDGVTVVKFAE